MLTPANALLRHEQVRKELVKLVVRSCCSWQGVSSSNNNTHCDASHRVGEEKEECIAWKGVKLKEDALAELRNHLSTWPLRIDSLEAQELVVYFGPTLVVHVHDLQVAGTLLPQQQQQQPTTDAHLAEEEESFAHRLARFVLRKPDPQLVGVLRLLSLFASLSLARQATDSLLASLFQQQLRLTQSLFFRSSAILHVHAEERMGQKEKETVKRVGLLLGEVQVSPERCPHSGASVTRTVQVKDVEVSVYRLRPSSSSTATAAAPPIDSVADDLQQLSLNGRRSPQCLQENDLHDPIVIYFSGTPIQIMVHPSSRDLAVVHTNVEADQLRLELSAAQLDALLDVYALIEERVNAKPSSSPTASYKAQVGLFEVLLGHDIPTQNKDNGFGQQQESYTEEENSSSSSSSSSPLYLHFVLRQLVFQPRRLELANISAYERSRRSGRHRCILHLVSDSSSLSDGGFDSFEAQQSPFLCANFLQESAARGARSRVGCDWDSELIRARVHLPARLFLDLGHHAAFKTFFDCFSMEEQPDKPETLSSLHSSSSSLSRLLGRRQLRLAIPRLDITTAVAIERGDEEEGITVEDIPTLDAMRRTSLALDQLDLLATGSSARVQVNKATMLLQQALPPEEDSAGAVAQEPAAPAFLTTRMVGSMPDAVRPQISLVRQNGGAGQSSAAAPWSADVTLPNMRLHLDQTTVDDLTRFAERATQEVPVSTKIDLSLRVTDFEGKVEGQAAEHHSGNKSILAQIQEGGITGCLSVAPL